MKVLLIEDVDHKAGDIVSFLEEALPKWSVIVVSSYHSACKRILEDHFDIVLLDMTMPSFDIGTGEDGGRHRPFGGREILRQMSRRQINTRTILITGFDRFGEGAEKMTLGQLNSELSRDFSMYMGCVHYDITHSGWREDLMTLLLESGEREK